METLRALRPDEYREAMSIQLACFSEETCGLAQADMTLDELTAGWTKWMSGAEENDDLRITIGAFDGGRMVAVAAASFAEETGIKGIELNGLWVCASHRGRGLSVVLIDKLLDMFDGCDIEQVIVYNYHCAPSNTYYRHLGFSVLRTETQSIGAVQFAVDIFCASADALRQRSAQ